MVSATAADYSQAVSSYPAPGYPSAMPQLQYPPVQPGMYLLNVSC